MIALSPDLYQPEPWAQQHAEKTYIIMFDIDNNKNKKWRIIARIIVEYYHDIFDIYTLGFLGS